MKAVGTNRVTELHDHDELHYHDFESIRLYKERMKMIHDKNIVEHNFKLGDLVLLYNSRLKLFPGKLKSRWLGPFCVLEVHPTKAVAIESKDGVQKFMVNGKRLKHHLGMDEEKVVSVIYLKEPQVLSEP
ncbi:uncharacterized protein [Nicotiana tomentosiformis]|uniref:uncharacterized protein n=1 Tax=Nicotiana tomentosiformis TaxID=4098 RepID=UPI00388CBBB4